MASRTSNKFQNQSFKSLNYSRNNLEVDIRDSTSRGTSKIHKKSKFSVKCEEVICQLLPVKHIIFRAKRVHQ